VTRRRGASEARRTEPRLGRPATASHVVFLPDRAAPRFFVWGGGDLGAPPFADGAPERVRLVDEALTARESMHSRSTPKPMMRRVDTSITTSTQ